MALSEIKNKCYIMRFKRIIKQKRKRANLSNKSKKIKVHVAVIVPDTKHNNNIASRNSFDGMNENTYSEIQEREFQNKMRTISFHEDYRPAYVGTISKKSSLISGRRPFARDTV